MDKSTVPTLPTPRDEMEEMDSVLDEMRREMHIELIANVRKGNRKVWKNMPPMQLLMEVYYHAGKLQEAVRLKDPKLIREYSADVANMAMMVADASGIFQTPPCVIRDVETVMANPCPTSLAAAQRSSKSMHY